MIRLRPYKACDAEAIITWTKNEYAFRQWSADRFQKYPICAKDMNVYYNNDKNNIPDKTVPNNSKVQRKKDQTKKSHNQNT